MTGNQHDALRHALQRVAGGREDATDVVEVALRAGVSLPPGIYCLSRVVSLPGHRPRSDEAVGELGEDG